MVKVVIADDEDRICRLIQALVDWDKMGMFVAGTAANGMEALDAVEKEHPDILITDIRMPGCSGLELISRARKVNPRMHIIIISGYAHFEYAREAIQYGVNEYLLKPINQKKLIEALRKIGDEIRDERRTDGNIADIRKDYERDVLKLRDVFLQDLLEKQGMVCSDEILRDQYHFMVKPGCFQVFCMKLDYENRGLGEETGTAAADKFIETIASGLKRHCYDSIAMCRRHVVCGVMNYAPGESESIRKILRDGLNQMEAQKWLMGATEFSVGLGVAVRSAEEIPVSLSTARVAIEERLIVGTGKLLDGFEKRPALLEQKLMEKYARNVDQVLDTLSLDAMEMGAEDLCRTVQENPEVHGWEVLEFVNLAGSLLAMRLAVKEKSACLKEFRNVCEDCSTIPMLFRSLKEFERKLTEEVFAKREDDSARPVRLAKQYIQNHYREPISLEAVSEKVGLSAAYFSVLFKKETNIGFAKYLMNVRVDEAKALLRDTNLPVSEICRRVGYYDLKHFTRIFQRIAGVKPTVFRKLYG